MTRVKRPQLKSGWCFAIVNNRLAEISFEKRYGIWGHCYVKREEYKTRQEQKWIREDTEKCRFTYRKGYYFDRIRGTKQKVPPRRKISPPLDKKKTILLKDMIQ